jgi:hypothetical protein
MVAGYNPGIISVKTCRYTFAEFINKSRSGVGFF